MPEGPSILHLSNKLRPFIGKKVRDAGGYDKMPTAWIKGQILEDIKTHGKHLFFIFSNGVVQLHLGMFGKVLVNERKEVNRRFYLEFDNGEVNGYVTIMKKLDHFPEEIFDERNDVLSKKFSAAFVKKLLQKHNGKLIADVLMDQKVFAGVGNKIRIEALYNAGVHPFSITGKIPAEKLDELIKEVRAYAKKFYNNLEKKGTNKDFKVYHLEYDPDGSEITMKYLPKTKRKIYFAERKQLLYE